MIALSRYKNVQWMLIAILALAPAVVLAQQDKNQLEGVQAKTEAPQVKTEEEQRPAEGAKAQPEKDAKEISGMSILGNQDAPKALVIVPWKSSEIGDSVGISTMLDDSRLPVDKEVFMRMLSYYEIRSETAHPSGEPVKTNAAQPATAAQRRKK